PRLVTPPVSPSGQVPHTTLPLPPRRRCALGGGGVSTGKDHPHGALSPSAAPALRPPSPAYVPRPGTTGRPLGPQRPARAGVGASAGHRPVRPEPPLCRKRGISGRRPHRGRRRGGGRGFGTHTTGAPGARRLGVR